VDVMYSEERIEEIIDSFKKTMIRADNFPRDNDPKDYRPFWIAFRGEGANLLGVTLYLYETVVKQQKSIDTFQSREQDNESSKEKI